MNHHTRIQKCKQNPHAIDSSRGRGAYAVHKNDDKLPKDS
jgi:hypothetical protein